MRARTHGVGASCALGDGMPRHSTAPSRSVICGVAGTTGDRDVIGVGGRLAGALDLRLRLVHVRRPVVAPDAAVPGVAGAAVYPVATAPLEPDVDLHAIAREAGFEDAEQLTVEGNPLHVLATMSEDPSTAWVVVGDAGEGPLRAAVRGSVSRPLVGKAACPVAIVPERLDDPTLRSVATVARFVDDDALAQHAAVVAGGLASIFGANLLLVTATGGTRRQSEWGRLSVAERLLERCSGEIPPEVALELVTAVGAEPDALLETARREQAGILVVRGPEHGLLLSALRGSTTHRVLAAAHEVVVVVPDAPLVEAPGPTTDTGPR